MGNLFESEPIKIGKKEWRVIVYPHPSYGNCTDYEWRTPQVFEHGRNWDAGPWSSMKEWPTYDSNDGMYAGCPKSLRRLFDRNLLKLKQSIPEL